MDLWFSKEDIKPRNVICLYYCDPEDVKHFKDDKGIKRSTTKSLFKERLHEGIIRCYKTSVNHEQYYRYEAWTKKHPGKQKLMLEEAGRNPRAIFIPLNKTVSVHGRDIKLNGGIKSLDPPCLVEAIMESIRFHVPAVHDRREF